MAQEKLFVMTQTDQEIHQLQTSRLILRNWRRKDIEPFAMLNSDPRVCEFLPTILSREETVTSAKKVTQYSFEALGLPETLPIPAKNNQRSRTVMDKLEMFTNEDENFLHPQLEYSHPVTEHVLYRFNDKE